MFRIFRRIIFLFDQKNVNITKNKNYISKLSQQVLKPRTDKLLKINLLNFFFNICLAFEKFIICSYAKICFLKKKLYFLFPSFVNIQYKNVSQKLQFSLLTLFSIFIVKSIIKRVLSLLKIIKKFCFLWCFWSRNVI